MNAGPNPKSELRSDNFDTGGAGFVSEHRDAGGDAVYRFKNIANSIGQYALGRQVFDVGWFVNEILCAVVEVVKMPHCAVKSKKPQFKLS